MMPSRLEVVTYQTTSTVFFAIVVELPSLSSSWSVKMDVDIRPMLISYWYPHLFLNSDGFGSDKSRPNHQVAYILISLTSVGFLHSSPP